MALLPTLQRPSRPPLCLLCCTTLHPCAVLYFATTRCRPPPIWPSAWRLCLPAACLAINHAACCAALCHLVLQASTYLAKRLAAVRKELVRLTDARVKLCTEVITGKCFLF